MNLIAHAVAVVAALLFASSATAQSSTPFVPADFAVPEKLEVAFPGRDIGWDEWRAIPDEKR